jgi:hypothetical protein
MGETCEYHILTTTGSIILIPFAIYLPTSTAGPGALIFSDFFTSLIFADLASTLHCAVNYSRTSLLIFSRLSEVIFPT